MHFTKKFVRASRHEIWLFLLECREDEERQADLPSKEGSSPILETMASFTDGTSLTEI